MLDIDFRFAVLSHACHLLALVLRRNIERESLEMHRVDMRWRVQQVPPTDSEIEIRDPDQRLHARLVAVGIVLAKNAEILARDMEPILYGDVEGAQFNLALEPIRKRLNNSLAKDGTCIVSRNDEKNRKGRGQYQCRPDEPSPATVLAFLR